MIEYKRRRYNTIRLFEVFHSDTPEKSPAFVESAFIPISNTKFKFELKNGTFIESAVFKMVSKGAVEYHACVSTQAGCKFGCTFCNSGKSGFSKNLSFEDILGEVDLMLGEMRIDRFDRIVFMGIGEPLDNYGNTVRAIKFLIKKYNLANRISLATVGIPEKLKRLATEQIPFEMIWVSLHAVFDEKRTKIMPLNKKYGIDDTIKNAAEFARITNTPTWINYMLIRGFNDKEEDTRQLVNLLSPHYNHLNLMLTIPNNTGTIEPVTYDDLIRFENELCQLGLKNKLVRFVAAGREINAGCGEFLFIRSK